MKYKKVITILAVLITICFLWTCNDDELPQYSGINKVELTISEDSISYIFSQITCELSLKPKFEIEQHGFCWDTIANVSIEKQISTNGVLTSQNFQGTIESLLPNKTYYVKAYIQNGDVIIYSNEINIQTLDARPVVTTGEITNRTGNRAVCSGNVNAYDTLFPITQRGVCWKKTQNPTISDSLSINGTGNGTYLSEMQNLEIGINYYVKAYAINSEGISYGEEISFSTLDGIPELTTNSINNVTASSATFYGNITDNDGLEILEKGFCWSTNINPTIGNSFQIVTGSTLGIFNKDITGLAVNTTFYVKAYLKNAKGTFYGNQLSFTTLTGLPTVTTTSISNITAISASSGGNVTGDGGFAITSRGVCWNTSSNPTILNNHTTNSSGTGSFLSNLTGLAENTTYYVRAYATNSFETTYGNEHSFTTNDGIPTLTTTSISNIMATSASSGGEITDDGGLTITARGVCWSTSSNPTITDNKTDNGTGTGTFTSNLTGLTELTTYYVRAYATNSQGTVYGNEISFTPKEILTDYDGNIYEIVKIGDQIWMAENLKTTHYADGTAIPLVTDNTAWVNLSDNNTDDAYCYYNNDANSQYGALYTWATAMNGAASSTVNPSGIQGACPDGWHLPSDAEWIELTDYLGGTSVAGGKMKEPGTTHWTSPNTGATNESGFTALPGGNRNDSSGSFGSVGGFGSWWSSTEGSSSNAYRRSLYYNSADVPSYSFYKSSGYSVRCVKD